MIVITECRTTQRYLQEHPRCRCTTALARDGRTRRVVRSRAPSTSWHGWWQRSNRSARTSVLRASQELGGALGLAVLATLAGTGSVFHCAFGAAAVLAAAAAVVGAGLLSDAGKST